MNEHLYHNGTRAETYVKYTKQVLVSNEWADKQIIAYANEGISNGPRKWVIRKKGLYGDEGRVPCSTLTGCVFVMLDA